MKFDQTDPAAAFDVVMLQLFPVSDAESEYTPAAARIVDLPAGHMSSPGAMPLPAPMRVLTDESIMMRDGTRILADVYLPLTDGPVPALMSWVPSGKRGRHDMLPPHLTDDERPFPRAAVSGYQMWLGVDPAPWTAAGYAVVNVDPRGCYLSEGDANYFGPAEADDGYDAVEWIAAQPWCDGNVGMAGNAFIAIEQWFIAAGRPPHLKAIAPWEGHADFYREEFVVGGIPKPADPGMRRTFGAGRIEFTAAMAEKRPLFDEYWESKRAETARIHIPTYAVASYANMNHARGTLNAFRTLSSSEKWLRIHRTVETHDFRDPASQADLRRFFDRYLKGIDNGWDSTPRVRYAILDHGHTDSVDVPSSTFPPPVAMTPFYLATTEALARDAPASASSVTYRADSEETVAFVLRFDVVTEIVGFPRLVLFGQAPEHDDLDIFCGISKLDAAGRTIPMNHLRDHPTHLGYSYSGPSTGRMRASLRGPLTDPGDVIPVEPAFRTPRPVRADEIVEIEISLPPIGIRFHPGEALELRVSGSDLSAAGNGLLPLGSAGNRGRHIIHLGETHPSRLILPLRHSSPDQEDTR